MDKLSDITEFNFVKQIFENLVLKTKQVFNQTFKPSNFDDIEQILDYFESDLLKGILPQFVKDYLFSTIYDQF